MYEFMEFLGSFCGAILDPINIILYRLARMLHQTYGRSASDSNLLNKLDRASFKITELIDIAELFDCEIKFVPKTAIEGNSKTTH